MAQAIAELCHQHGAETTVGFEVYGEAIPETVAEPCETVAEPVAPKQRKPRVVKVKPRGRPRVYNGTQRRQVAAALKKLGLTKALPYLAKEKNLKVSLTLARSVAEEFGIEFQRGRPAA